jgi:sec-independent protein translocase protein TatA
MAIAPLFIPGGLGGPELVIILLIAVLLFGANKIPKLARATGQAMGEFQRGREELEDELDEVTGDLSTDPSAPQTETTQTEAAQTETETETAQTEAETETESNSGSNG